MMRSLFSAISGMQAHQNMVDVISNNIANVNTHGFKSNRVTFADQLSQTMFGGSRPNGDIGGINPRQVGLGTRVSSIDAMMQQGALEQTGNTLDLAINGDAFFVVSSGDKKMYTRAGAFTLDSDGYVTMQGQEYRLNGRMADENGAVNGSSATGLLRLPLSMKIAAASTSRVDFASNLDADATTSVATLGGAGATGISQVSGTASDGAGGVHSITITGTNATRDALQSMLAVNVTSNTRLGDVGGAGNVTGVNFSIATDGGPAQAITGLSVNSTVGDLINAINTQIPGAIASLSGNSVLVQRRHYGDSATYNLQFADVAGGTPPNNLVNTLFGATTRTAGGLNSTLAAVDSFTPTGATAASYTNRALTLTANSDGLMTGLSGVGGSGVTVTASNGVAAGTATVNAADTTHSTSITVYDSLGVGHNLNVTFSKTGVTNEWRWAASLPSETGVQLSGNAGKVTFNSNGTLASFTYDNGATAVGFTPNGGGDAVSIALNAGTIGSLTGITQTSSGFSTAAIAQNGYASGKLDGMSVDGAGNIVGSFTNGLTRTLAQIDLASFTNPQGLARAGGNLFETTANSGTARILPAGSSTSQLYSGYLELSNVDLAKEFTGLIIGQRGYSANTRSIMTTDQILMETLQIKR